MKTLLTMFFETKRSTAWAVIGCLLVASAAEGIGFTSMIPLLSVATGIQSDEPSPVMTYTQELMDAIGLPISIGILLSFFIIMMIMKSLLSFIAMAYVSSTVAEFSTQLRLQIIKNIFNVNWSYFAHNPIGKLTVAAGAQAQSSSKAYQLVAMMITGSIESFVYLIVAFFISWPLALAAIVIGLFIVSILHILVRISRKAGIRLTQYTRELNVFLTDTLINIKPLRAMTRQGAFSHLLTRKINSLKKAMRRGMISKEGLKYSQEILITLILGIGFYIAIIAWEVPIIELAVVGVLLRKTTSNITKIQRTYQEAVSLERPYTEVRELIMETATNPENNPGKSRASLEKGIRLEAVRFHYDDKEVLHSVNMDIPAHGITVLTGPSGSGKTTIADLILGLHTPSAGEIRIDDKPLRVIDLAHWRRMIGYVPQDLVLFHDTLHANITLGDPDIDDETVRQALETAGAWDFINAMPDGIMSIAGQQGTKLSGGQRQRIAIARALVLNPRLLILDEVTSALDNRTEREICENIRSLSSDITIFAITHRPALLEIADRIYAIEDGAVEAANDLKSAADDR